MEKIWSKSIASENLIETAEIIINAIMEIARFLGKKKKKNDFKSMTERDIQEQLVEAEIIIAGLL